MILIEYTKTFIKGINWKNIFFLREQPNKLQNGEARFANQGNILNSHLLNIPKFHDEQGQRGGRGKADELKC